MLDNLGEFRSLGSSLYRYIIFILVTLIISFLPYKIVLKKLYNRRIFLLLSVIFLGISVSTAFANRIFYSPALSLSLTLYRHVRSKVVVRNYKTTPLERERILQKFYRPTLAGDEITIIPPPPLKKQGLM
jgi:hypothetical protein